MTCREFEQQLGQPLCAEAGAHAAGCKACGALSQWFDAPASVPAIAVAVEGLKPVRSLPSPWILAAAILLAGAVVMTVGSRQMGLFGWDTLEPFQRISIFTGLAIAGAASSLLLAQQMFPTRAGRMPPQVCLAVTLTAMAAGPVALMPLEFDAADFSVFGLKCAEYGLFYSLLAAIPIWLLIRKGYFVQPGWAGALTGLVCGICATVALELYCPLIERAHVLVWHGGVVVVAVMAAAMIAYFTARLRGHADSRAV